MSTARKTLATEESSEELSPGGRASGPRGAKSETAGAATKSDVSYTGGASRPRDFFDSRTINVKSGWDTPVARRMEISSPPVSQSPVLERANFSHHSHSSQSSGESSEFFTGSGTTGAARLAGGVDFYIAPRIGSPSADRRSPKVNCSTETSATDYPSTASLGPSPQTSSGSGCLGDSGSTGESNGSPLGGLLWETPSMTRHVKREWRRPDTTVDFPASPTAGSPKEPGGSGRLGGQPNYPWMVVSPRSSKESRDDVERTPRPASRQVTGRNITGKSSLPGDEAAGGRIARLGSTGSLFNMTGTIVAPNTRKLISAVAAIFRDQMEEDQDTTVDNIQDFHLFDEEWYLSQGAEDSPVKSALSDRLREAPDEEEIGAFITSLYEAAEFSPECNILCLLYINRLMAFTGMPLLHRNWRPLVFTALILAQKVWDDKFLGNSDFAAIYPFFSKEEINRMEATFLKLVQYEVVVKPSTYAQYYFELRSMFQEGEDFPSRHPKVIANSGLESRSLLLAERLSGRGVDDKSLTSI